MIFDEGGLEVKNMAGPFNEDGNLILTCEASGGTLQAIDSLVYIKLQDDDDFGGDYRSTDSSSDVVAGGSSPWRHIRVSGSGSSAEYSPIAESEPIRPRNGPHLPGIK